MAADVRAMPPAQGAARLPIVVRHAAPPTAADRRALDRLAEAILLEEPHLGRVPPFRGDVGIGTGEGPALVIEDHSGVLGAHRLGADLCYRYRALVLAGEGDALAVCGPRDLAFEAYCRDVLGLGCVTCLSPRADRQQLPAVACAEDPEFIEQADAMARAAGGLNLVPYMATGGVWLLAGRIARRLDVPVRVACPPPELGRQVNDKTWFVRTARRLLGEDAVPPSRTVYGMAGLVGHLRRLGRRSASVAVKLTHAAASGGNLVLDSVELEGRSPLDLREHLTRRMTANGWSIRFPMQVTAWEAPLVTSPSAQLWVPLPEDGDPVVEGIFDQQVAGRQARFSGAAHCGLSPAWLERIAREATLLAGLFQRLGYFGRCSFDAVLSGAQAEGANLHWVECNGRWGGVSIPMTLANRLRGDWARGGFLVAGPKLERLALDSTSAFLETFADDLYRPGADAAGAILLSPGQLAGHSGVDLLFLARDQQDAMRRSESLMRRLAG